MEKQNRNDEILKNLELLNKQMTEFLKLKRKASTGYNFLNANELAEMLGESIKTVYARVHKRQIPFYKPGGKVFLFKMDEIQAWIRAGRHSSIDELTEGL